MQTMRPGAGWRALIAGAAFAAGAISLAHGARAADLASLPGAGLEPLPAPEIVEFGSGWYLRGDLSYSHSADLRASYSNVKFNDVKLDDGALYGAGAGYKFTNWLRGDVTADWRSHTDFSGTTTSPGCCTSTEKARLSGYTVLLNAYADLGTWSGITPYIGAGVGVAGTIIDQYSSQGYSLGKNCRCGVPVGSRYGYQTFGKSDNNTLAYAAMAGVAINVDRNLIVDIGYRYLNIEGANTRRDLYGYKVGVKDLSFHEARIGLRYMID